MATARANAILASRKVVLAGAGKPPPGRIRSNAIHRGAARHQDQFLMKLNEAAMAVKGVSFVSSQILFVDEQKYFRLQ